MSACGLALAVCTFLLGAAVTLAAFVVWGAAQDDADRHTSPTEWPSRRNRPWDAP